MNINLYLELRSEAIIGQLECELTEFDDYFVLRTPANPDYHYGNLLTVKCQLDTHTKSQWLQQFDNAFTDMPKVEHYTFCWPRNLEQVVTKNDFIADGFSYEEVHVLSLERGQFSAPSAFNSQVSMRELTNESDWQQWLNLSLAEQSGDYDPTGLSQHLQTRMANYQALGKAGCGVYMGAFIGEQLIGYAGLYHQAELARFQHVHVIPAYQNQNIAKTLLAMLINQAPKAVATFVIVADEHYHATKLYQSLGFTIAERNCSVSWWPQSQRIQDND